MNERNNPKLTALSQNLRKEMTREEKHLWYDFLQRLPITINRQKVIGKYIADFYCAKAKLVIELDGRQHYNECRMSKRQKAFSWLIYQPPNKAVRFVGATFIETEIDSFL